MPDTTPMMKQYDSIKARHRDKILFFRLGDFYEMFKSDAAEASRILGLTLTSRNGIPMCGIPYHAAQSYIPKLLDAGRKVAICEQTKMPEGGKGIAERDVVEVITPGTVIEEHLLKRGKHNFLASLSGANKDGGDLSLALIDVSTGDVVLSSHRGNTQFQTLRADLESYAPREILVQESLFAGIPWLSRELGEKDVVVNRYPDWHFTDTGAAELLKVIMGVQNLKAFGIEDRSPLLDSLGPLLTYVEENAGRQIARLNSIRVMNPSSYMLIDSSSQKNLELVNNLRDSRENQSLFKIIDQTRTSMGRRLLRNWILHPLTDIDELRARQDRTELLYHDQLSMNRLRDILGKTLDLPRLASRIGMEKAHPKDLVAIRKSIEGFLDSYRLLEGGGLSDFFPKDILPILQNRAMLIESAVVDDPPTGILEGGIIADGYDEEIDRLRETQKNGENMLDQYLESEREKTGIGSLKIKHNRVIGHFLEISKTQAKSAPDYFHRRQSLVNADRFTTDELDELADRILNAQERIHEREKLLFLDIRRRIRESLAELQQAGRVLAELDCIQSFAYQATLKGYTRPEITDEPVFSVHGGRHAVVETFLDAGGFVPNDLGLNMKERDFFSLITGPNMAGKSTYLRQNALIAILSQIGSFVPAEKVRVGICDRVFCRVGASDNLARGESTFLVEMNETAHILRQATPRSLVIMDEVGRGTSTQDGLSIAWAVCEYILNHVQCRTLFATHFHELSELQHSSLRNRSLAVDESEGGIVFLNKVIDGPSDNSYGIHVAQIAGIPDEVIFRAGEILEEILSASGSLVISQEKAGKKSMVIPAKSRQRGLFGQDEMVIQEILHLDLNAITPLEALNHLSRMKKNLADPL